MKLFTGKYWVPFPSTEYGGRWVVVAKDRAQCIALLEEVNAPKDEYIGDFRYNDRIPEAVDKALQYDIVGDYTAGVVDMFTT
jgi:hypothetical protein